MAFVPWRFGVFRCHETRFRWTSSDSQGAGGAVCRAATGVSGAAAVEVTGVFWVLVVFCPVELRKGVGSWLGAFVLLY